MREAIDACSRKEAHELHADFQAADTEQTGYIYEIYCYLSVFYAKRCKILVTFANEPN